MLIFHDRSVNVGKFDCFKIVHGSWNTRSALACPEMQGEMWSLCKSLVTFLSVSVVSKPTPGKFAHERHCLSWRSLTWHAKNPFYLKFQTSVGCHLDVILVIDRNLVDPPCYEIRTAVWNLVFLELRPVPSEDESSCLHWSSWHTLCPALNCLCLFFQVSAKEKFCFVNTTKFPMHHILVCLRWRWLNVMKTANLMEDAAPSNSSEELCFAPCMHCIRNDFEVWIFGKVTEHIVFASCFGSDETDVSHCCGGRLVPLTIFELSSHVNGGSSSSQSMFNSIGQCVSFRHQCSAANSTDSRWTPTQRVKKHPYSVHCFACRLSRDASLLRFEVLSDPVGAPRYGSLPVWLGSSDHLWVCRVSAMMITFFRVNTLWHVSPCRHPKMGRMRKRRSDHSRQVHSSILWQNRRSTAIRSFNDQISWRKCPTAIVLASVAGVTMYMIVLPCGTVLVNKFHKAWLVSVMNAALLDTSFFCLLFNVTRLSFCKSGENRESSMHTFGAREETRFRQQSCVLLSKRIRMKNDHTAHRSRIERFDIVKSPRSDMCTRFRMDRTAWRLSCSLNANRVGKWSLCPKGRTSSQETACLHSIQLILVQCTSDNVESCPSAPLLWRANSVLS